MKECFQKHNNMQIQLLMQLLLTEDFDATLSSTTNLYRSGQVTCGRRVSMCLHETFTHVDDAAGLETRGAVVMMVDL
jgi:hypothetical protein